MDSGSSRRRRDVRNDDMKKHYPSSLFHLPYSLFDTKKAAGVKPAAFLCLEAPPGFEPGIKALQASALPLGHGAINWGK